MSLYQIADDVRRFLLASVPSVPFLEAILLMQNEPTMEWDGSQLARRLYLTETAANQLLHELQEAGLLIPVEQDQQRFYYAPSSEELRDLIRRVGITYSRHLVEVTNLIHSAGQKKPRRGEQASTPPPKE